MSNLANLDSQVNGNARGRNLAEYLVASRTGGSDESPFVFDDDDELDDFPHSPEGEHAFEGGGQPDQQRAPGEILLEALRAMWSARGWRPDEPEPTLDLSTTLRNKTIAWQMNGEHPALAVLRRELDFSRSFLVPPLPELTNEQWAGILASPEFRSRFGNPRPVVSGLPTLAKDLFSEPDAPTPQILPGVVVEGQLGFLAGPSKILKTRALLDMGVAITAGVPWLGYQPWTPPYVADNPRKVGIWSSESGRTVLRRRLATTCDARQAICGATIDVRARVGDNLYIEPRWLPDLSNPQSVKDWAKYVKDLGLCLAALDPMLQILGEAGKDIANDAIIGPLLRQAQEAIYPCTLLILHHTQLRPVAATPWPSREDMVYGWASRFVRQWIMLDRVGMYNAENRSHELRLHIGGSDDQDGGDFYLHAEEGHARDRWHTQVTPRGVATANAQLEINTRQAAIIAAVVAAVRAEPEISETRLYNLYPTGPVNTKKSEWRQAVDRLAMERRVLRETRRSGQREFVHYVLPPG